MARASRMIQAGEGRRNEMFVQSRACLCNRFKVAFLPFDLIMHSFQFDFIIEVCYVVFHACTNGQWTFGAHRTSRAYSKNNQCSRF
jgi:hypothetical protein